MIYIYNYFTTIIIFISFLISISHALSLSIIIFSPSICLISLLSQPTHSRTDLIRLTPRFKIQIIYLNHRLIPQNQIHYPQNLIMINQMIRRQIHCLSLIIPILGHHLIHPRQSKLHLRQTF